MHVIVTGRWYHHQALIFVVCVWLRHFLNSIYRTVCSWCCPRDLRQIRWLLILGRSSTVSVDPCLLGMLSECSMPYRRN